MDPDAVEAQRSPVANNNNPAPTITLFPTRTASFVPTTDVTATEPATGRRRTPVPSGVYPFTNWKYWTTRKMKPERAKKEMATEPLAAVNRGLRKRATSSMGCSVRCSTRTKRLRSAKPPRMVPKEAEDLHPQFGASMTPKISTVIPAADSSQTSPVDRRGTRIPRGRHPNCDEDRDTGGDDGHEGEDAAPPVALQEPPTDNRTSRYADPGRGTPQPDRHGAFATLGEDIDEEGERRGEHQSRPETHEGTRSNEFGDGPGKCTGQAAHGEYGQPDNRTPLRPRRSLRLPAAKTKAANTRL